MRERNGTAVELGEPLWVEILKDGRRARLLREHKVRIKELNIVVPTGFETDFASIPRIFWRVVPPWGRYSPAAVVHDYLYATAPGLRKRADKVFLEHMKALGVNWITRKVMYRVVRMGGGFSWRKHREEEKGKAE